MKRMTLAMIALAVTPGIIAAQQTDTTGARRDSAQAQGTPTTQDTSAAGAQRTGGAAQDTSYNQQNRQSQVDSGRTNMQEAGDSLHQGRETVGVPAQGQQGQASAHSGRMARGNMGLTRSQVRQLQEALNGTGCDAGKVDGIIGPRTRAAIDCARSQKGITGDDNAELYRALNLNFEGSGAASGRNTSPSGAATDTTGGATGGAVTDTTGGATRDTTRDTTGGPTRDTTGGTTGGSQGTTDSAQARPDSARPPR